MKAMNRNYTDDERKKIKVKINKNLKYSQNVKYF